MSAKKNITNFIAHLTPVGTPVALIRFIVCIELVSLLIRPLTLAVRLTANLVAGHLLLFLLAKLAGGLGSLRGVTLLPMVALGALEIMVSLIQAYVITLLVILYFKEIF